MSGKPICRATRLPCCFGCHESVCELVDVHGVLDSSDKPAPAKRRRWFRWFR